MVISVPKLKKNKPLYGKFNKIPVNWELRSIKDLVKSDKKVTYGIVQPGEYDPNGILLIRGKDYTNGWADEEDFFRVSETLHNDYIRSITKAGDVLICIVGSVGISSLVPEWISISNITQTTARISCDGKKINSKFMMYFLNSPWGRLQSLKFTKGSVQPGLNLNDVEKFLIPCPSIHEQKKIVDILSNVDNLIGVYGKAIDSTKVLKKGLMQKLLTKGIGHKKFIKTSLGPRYLNVEIPESWKIYKLKDMLTQSISYGIILHNEVKNGVPMIVSGNIGDKNGIKKNLRYINPQIEKKYSRTRLKGGEILIALVGATIGQLTVAPEWCNGYNVSRHLAVIRFKDDFIPVFFAYLLKLSIYQKKIIIQTVGSAQPVINLGQLSSFKILIPERKEQQKIASILSSTDDKISELESKKQSLESLKKGLMQKLLTGQIRVKV